MKNDPHSSEAHNRWSDRRCMHLNVYSVVNVFLLILSIYKNPKTNHKHFKKHTLYVIINHYLQGLCNRYLKQRCVNERREKRTEEEEMQCWHGWIWIIFVLICTHPLAGVWKLLEVHVLSILTPFDISWPITLIWNISSPTPNGRNVLLVTVFYNVCVLSLSTVSCHLLPTWAVTPPTSVWETRPRCPSDVADMCLVSISVNLKDN